MAQIKFTRLSVAMEFPDPRKAGEATLRQLFGIERVTDPFWATTGKEPPRWYRINDPEGLYQELRATIGRAVEQDALTVTLTFPDDFLTPVSAAEARDLERRERAAVAPHSVFERPGTLLRSQEQTARTLVPPIVQTVFQLCGPDKPAAAMELLQQDKRMGLRFPAAAKAENYVSLSPDQPIPTALRNARERERLEAWIREQTQADLSLLDELCWDVFMACLVTFFKRTPGRDIRERFTFLFSDVFAYKDIKPTHQSPELKGAIFERMRYLSSQRLILSSSQPLHVLDPVTERRKLQAGAVHGPAFGWLGDVYSVPDGKLTTEEGKTLQGVRVTLGEWARELVSNEAYLGQALLKLGRYNSGRQLWERRIGFYLLFQLYNQATRAAWREVDGDLRMVAPQQPLCLETILNGAGMDWKRQGQATPSKLIHNYTTALEKLNEDGLFRVQCLDGPADGSDLESRGRLPQLLKRRFNVLPGPLLEPHLAAKAQVKTAAVQKAAQAREQRQRRASDRD
jgi:hypothetical protein